MREYYADDTSTVYHGDSLDLLRQLPGASVAALVTDPPYSSGGQYRGDRMQATGSKYSGAEVFTTADFAGDNRDQRSFLTWMGLWLTESLRVVAPGGFCLLFTDWRQLPTMTDALQVGGWVWRGIVPWVKPWSRPAFKQRSYLNQCEYVIWGTVGSSVQDETVPLPGFYHAASPREREHQTQKPLDVMRSLVRVAPVGGVVLDPFAGGGTTGVAAVLEGRQFIGVEITEHYAALTAQRLREARGQYVDRGTQTAIPEPEEAAS
jgi:site-specific DNA-methyltransferase (adenine-specific)